MYKTRNVVRGVRMELIHLNIEDHNIRYIRNGD